MNISLISNLQEYNIYNINDYYTLGLKEESNTTRIVI